MAFFGQSVGFSGLFGVASAPRFQTQIIGLSGSLISASIDSKLTQAGLRNLSPEDRAAINARTPESAVTAPWKLPEETKTLNQQVREVRELTQFINLKDADLAAVADDVDTQATFAIFKALSNLRVLAEYAAEDTTINSSLGRLDKQFQAGLSEVRDYISTADLEKLDLFLGEKESKVEAQTRTGKNQPEFGGSLVAGDPTAAVTGLTGTEVFTVSVTKSGETDDFVIDLSQVSGTLSLNNIKDYINTQIEALTIVNKVGETVPKHVSRFDVHSQTVGKEIRYGLEIDGTITEEISLTAAVSEPTLYVATSISQVDSTAKVDDGFAVTSRITELNNLSGTIAVDGSTSFSGVDYEASELKEKVAALKDDAVDPEVAALRDKFRADALEAARKQAKLDGITLASDVEVVDNDLSITNLDNKYRVSSDTTSSRVAVDSEGGIYVVGSTTGSFGHQLNVASENDVFLTKFDNEGNAVFSRLLGVTGNADAYGIAVDSNDNVIIVGQTDSELSTSDVIDTKDAFVTKISKRGDEVFRYQLDTAYDSKAFSVAVDSNNDIYVGGQVKSVPASSQLTGHEDALLLKIDGALGTLTDSHVFGTSGNEAVKGIAVDANDNLVVATESSGNAVVYRIDGTDLTSTTATVDFGALGSSGSVQGVAIDNTNNAVYVSGVTTNGSLDASGTATVNETALGVQEGFVSGLTLSGATALTADFTTYLSTSGTDRIQDVVVNDGTVYVAGSTSGTLSGELSRGAVDAFAAKINGSTGVIEDIEQYGEGHARNEVGGLAFTTKGDSVLETLGLPTGTIEIDQTLDVETQTSAQVGDFFYISIEGGLNKKTILKQGDSADDILGRRKKITLEAGDTLDDIKRKIRIAGLSKVKAETAITSEGQKLTISTYDDGVTVDLLPGTNGRDLLQHLGLAAGRLLPKDEIFGLNSFAKDENSDPSAPENLGGAFALGIDGALNIKDKANAKYVLGLLDKAVTNIQRAFRSLTFDPLKEALKNGNNTNGPVPQHLQNQLANFQTGLARLQSGSSSPSVSLFV